MEGKGLWAKRKGILLVENDIKRDQRLQNARTKWLPTATAKNIAKSYSKWYGVDLLCAITELEILGHTFGEQYKKQVKVSIASKSNAKRRKKEEKEEDNDFPYDSDDTFSFIAGYTENGAPFGVTWEED